MIRVVGSRTPTQQALQNFVPLRFLVSFLRENLSNLVFFVQYFHKILSIKVF